MQNTGLKCLLQTRMTYTSSAWGKGIGQKCSHCLAFSKQVRKNRENRLRRLLWDRALLQSDPLVSAPKPGSSSVVLSSRPSDEGASTMGDRPASSPKKKHEKRKHTGSDKLADHKKARKDKAGKLPKKPKDLEHPKHRDSGSTAPSVPMAVAVLTPPGLVLQAAMRVTPPGARSPTPMPPATLEADVEMSPPRSHRSHFFELRSEGWYHPYSSYYHGWGDPHSVRHYPAPRGRFSPPAPCNHPLSSVPRCASPVPTREESSRSLSPAESSSSAPPYYGIDSDESEVDSTSPDIAVTSQGPGLPDESHVSFVELMSHLVQSLEIDTIQRPGPSMDKFYDVVHGEQSTSIVLPLITTLRQAMTQPWDLPAHPQPTSRRYEFMYRVREEDIPFLLHHPKPNLVVVESSQGREAGGHTVPRDKEGRKIDSLARQVYAASRLGLRISNYEATRVRYQYFIMQHLHNVVLALPDNQGDLAKVFIKEAMQVAVQQLSTARHHVDTDSRALVGAVSLRRHEWLCNCNFLEETKRRIEDMPFDRSGLFHSRTDHKLKKIHEFHMTAQRMELQPQTRLRQLLRKGAIRQLTQTDGLHRFCSRYFTVPKWDGGLRPILDLRNTNWFITAKKFRMTTLQNILLLLRKEDWFASLDLKDTYFHISIHPCHRRFLRFAVAAQLFEFTILPFRLATVLRVFTKCMAPVCAFPRLQGVQIYPYLDDWLLVSQSREGLLASIRTTCALLEDLGLCINTKKSSLLLVQTITFIRASLDSTVAKAFLPRDRQQTLAWHIHQMRRDMTVPARSIQRLLGHMAASVAVVPHARLRLYPLQLLFNKMFRPQTDLPTKLIRIPSSVLHSLLWWSVPANLTMGVPFRPQCPSVTLDVPRHRVVQITSDNVATVFYLNKQGGTKSPTLARLSMQIWEWCIPRDITPMAVHLAGALPDKADLMLDPLMDQELDKLVAQVSGLSISNMRGDTASLPSRPSPRISSPWRPLHHRRKIDTESDGSTEETDSSEN
ncbi:hypothetical protein EYD10_02473 [Varanus komodoensis]|nr:hypothetical protein EYD10_02473 [Varanus komodoensis]